MSGHTQAFDPDRFLILNNPERLHTEVSEYDLARLLDLRGDEDVLDLGSGTGFYTDRIAALTKGNVYAVELQHELIEHYRERGVPPNVRVIHGDITALPVAPAAKEVTLQPASVDVACSIATWHETGDKLDLRSLMRILRPQGKLVVMDWRKDPESWECGPREVIRYTKEEVAEALAPYFPWTHAEDLGRYMFAVVAQR